MRCERLSGHGDGGRRKRGEIFVSGTDKMMPMHVSLSKTFRFESAHFLPCFPEGHKCRRMHGHSFRFRVVVKGEVDPAKGYLVNFSEIKQAVAPLVDELDHRVLNEIPGLEVPTAELLAKWIFDRVKPKLPLLSSVVVYETCTSEAEYAPSLVAP